MSESDWPIDIRPAGLASCGAVLWRYRDGLQLTAIVKGTFSISPGGAMALVASDGLHPHHGHHDDVLRELLAAHDLAPYRAKADVMVTGWVHAAPEAPASEIEVRVAVIRDRSVVDKAVRIAGDPVHGFATPRPLVGLGPFLLPPPACGVLLGVRGALLSQQPWPEIPDDFDWAHLQAVPPDQQIDFLRGDEQIVLENVYASHRVLAMRLPGVGAVGKMYGLEGAEAGRALVLSADMLHVDAERGRCSITWRASMPLPRESDLARIRVVAGVEVEGQPLILSGPVSDRGAGFDVARRLGASDGIDVAGRAPMSLEGTLELTAGVTQGAALPFVPAPAAPRLIPTFLQKISAALAPRLGLRGGASAHPFEGTLDLTAAAAETAPVLPFAKGSAPRPSVPHEAPPAPIAAPIRESEPEHPLARTLDLSSMTTIAGLVAPFAIARPGEAPPAPSAPIPGAPWSAAHGAEAPASIGKSTLLDLPSRESEVAEDDEDEDDPSAVEESPAPVAAAEPPARSTPAPAEKPSWSWAQPEPEPEKPRPPPAPKPPPKPAVTDALYGGFGPKKKKKKKK